MTPVVVDHEKDDRLSFIEQFIARHYAQQSAPVRTITFLVFVLLFAYGFVVFVGGDKIVGGVIFDAPDGAGLEHLAKNYDVKIGRTLVGTNSKGEYGLPLSSAMWAEVFIGHPLKVTITNRDGVYVGDFELRADRLPMGFEDLHLHQPQVAASTVSSLLDVVVPSLEAAMQQPVGLQQAMVQQRLASRGNRLFILQVHLPSGTSVRAGNFDCACNGSPHSLVASGSRQAAGSLPIRGDSAISYDYDFYFDLGPASQVSAGSMITLVEDAKWLGYREQFSIPRAIELGRETDLRGSRGSMLRVILLAP